MATIDTLNTFLNNKILIDKFNLRSVVEPSQNAEVPLMQLFLTGENTNLKIGRVSNIGLYSQGVQIAVRHNDYDKARTGAFEALQLLSRSKYDLSGVSVFIGDQSPEYLGIQEGNGAHVWAFTIQMLGDR